MKKKAPAKKKPVKNLDLEDLFDDTDFDSKTDLNKPIILMLSGEIGKAHEGIIHDLIELHYDKEFNDVVTLLINSEGGDACVGWAIVDTMDFVRFPIQTTVIGMAASAAADIFVNGDTRTMSANSTLMIHDAAFGHQGKYNDLVAQRKYHDIEYDRGVNHYLVNSKYNTVDELKKQLLPGTDVYLTPEEAVMHGVADNIAAVNKNKRSKVKNYIKQ